MVRRWVSGSVRAVVLFAVVAAACTSSPTATDSEGGGGDSAGSSGEEVTLDFWTYQEGQGSPNRNPMVEAFEAEHPNINIEYTYIPAENYNVKLNTAIAAGEAPDLVLAFDLNLLIEGALLPLDDMVADKGIDLSNFNQGIIKGPGDYSCTWNDTLYCLASNQGGWGIFYNKDLFDAAGVAYPDAWPPMTVEEYADKACRLTDPDAGVWGAAVPSTIMPFEVFLSPDGRTAEGYFNGAEAVHQFDVLSSMVRDGCSPGENTVDPWDGSADFFQSGALAMAVTDFDEAETFEKAGINYGVTGPPTPPGFEPFFDVYGDNTAVTKTSDHPEEALEYIAFLATEGQQIAYEAEGSIPIDHTVAEQIDWAGDVPGRKDILEVLSNARPPIFIPDRWNVLAPFFDAWGFTLEGSKTPQEALDDAAASVQENLDSAWATWDEENAGGG
jgi:multiple sugar transport system substrate-binding protein